MGDFDRKETAGPASQTKQIAIVVALGVVLIGVVGYHMMKQGPQTASAASFVAGGTAVTGATSTESPEDAMAALKVDPTRNLQLARTEDHTFDKAPHNPFVMDDNWRSSLFKRSATAVTPIRTNTNTPRVIRPDPLPVKIESFRLGSILQNNGKLSAIINDKIVSIGMTVDGARVIEITKDHVLLQNADFLDGPTSELTLQPKMK